VKTRLEACQNLLIPKGEEYSRNGERLHNFKRAGRIDNEAPERSLWGMYKKHLVSVMDMIEDIEQGILPDHAIMAEKMNDSINYHLLLEGLITERLQKQAELEGDKE